MTSGVEEIAGRLLDGVTAARRIVAIAGAPGAGKSTFAGALERALNARRPGVATVMPMDGYHLDNAILDARGLRAVKGAPETFDVDGLASDLARVRAAGRAVLVPVFDRTLDLARACAREIAPDTPLVLLEGNYLLLERAPWPELAAMFDTSIYLDVPEAELERRLVERWLAHGHDAGAARARALGNDIPNARLVAAASRPADITVTQPPAP